jgi:dolichyl-phosphate beta-glucosyltransferase
MQFRQNISGSQSPQFSLVLPAYNPGPAIHLTWQKLQAFWLAKMQDWEFVFVCDGCTDGTSDTLRALTADARDRVRVLSYERNHGKGYAVRLGLQAARGHWRLFTDVDLAYSLDDVLRLAKVLEQGAEVAIASRDHPESRFLATPKLLGYLYRRRLQSQIFGAIVKRILPLQTSDTQAGLKGLSASAATKILPLLQCNGFEFDCELLTACARLGIRVAEMPVTVSYDTSTSTTSARDVLAMLPHLWAIRRTWSAVPQPPIPMIATELRRQVA